MKGMILAAGLGTRLGELTKTQPKCLMNINGTRIVEFALNSLKAVGISEVIVNLHYLPDSVREFIKDGSKWGLSVEYSFESALLGTGGAVKKAKDLIGPSQPLLLINADIYSEFKLSDLVNHLRTHPIDAALAVSTREESSYLLSDSEMNLAGWSNAVSERLVNQKPVGKYGFCGLQILGSEILNHIYSDPRKEFSIIDSYLSAVELGMKIGLLDIGSALWIDIGTVEQLEALRHRS